MYLDKDLKSLPVWAGARWARWAINPDAPLAARLLLEQLRALDHTRRRMRWITVPLTIAKSLAAIFAVAGVAVVFFTALISFAWALPSGQRDEASVFQRVSEEPLFWPIVFAGVLAFFLHGLQQLLIGPIEGERRALIAKLTDPQLNALRRTPRIDEFKVPEVITDDLAWATAVLLIEYNARVNFVQTLNTRVHTSREHHLSTEEQQLQDEQQEAYERERERTSELATQIADAFHAAGLRITEETQ